MPTVFSSTRTTSIAAIREWLATMLKINRADPNLEILAGIVGHSIDFVSECADKKKMPTAKEASVYIAGKTLKIFTLTGSSMARCIESAFEVTVSAVPAYRAVSVAAIAGGPSNPLGGVLTIHAIYASLSLALAVIATYENCSAAIRKLLQDAKFKYLNQMLLNQNYRMHLLVSGRNGRMMA